MGGGGGGGGLTNQLTLATSNPLHYIGGGEAASVVWCG